MYSFRCSIAIHALYLFILMQNVRSDTPKDCSTRVKLISYLDVATDLINKAKDFYPTCPTVLESKPVDCADFFQLGHNASGEYTIWPSNRILDGNAINVYCDMDTDDGGWTVIQRRGNFSRPKDYFFKDWESYKKGFGDIKKDFWLGNDNIFTLTNQRLYTIRFDMKDVEGNKAYAMYDSFWIDDEYNNYRLHIQDYSGNAGDSMIKPHNLNFFSTKDKDNDNSKIHCAQNNKGAWWYNSCLNSNLNGQYLRGKVTGSDGIHWHSWKGFAESLDATEMKIRPKEFKVDFSSEFKHLNFDFF